MAETAPEAPTELRGGSHRKATGFNPVAIVRGLVQSSPWFVIAIAAHAVVLAVFAVWKLGHGDGKKDDAVVITTTIKKNDVVEEPPEDKKDELIDRTAIPENQTAEIVSNEVAQLLPNESPVDPNRDLSQDIGDPNSQSDMPNSDPTGGTSVGVGQGGHRGTGTPSPFAGRKLGTGLKKGVLPGGPTQGTEEAIRIGLIWLARHQNENGSWSAMTCKDHCPADKPCQPESGVGQDAYTDKFDVGLTSLSLLAFLGAGYGHNAKQYVVDTFKAKKYELGKDVVLKGLKWLISKQNPDGSFSSPSQRVLYNEAIAALALSEAYGLTQARAWKEPAQKAINFLCSAQKDSPISTGGKWGWRYDAPQDITDRRSEFSDDKSYQAELHDADTSVTGWMVMALKSAHASGLEIPKGAEEGAISFVKWASAQDGLVGYYSPQNAGQPIQGEHDQQYKYHAPSLAAVAMCVRIFLEQNIDDPYLKLSADHIIKSLPSVDNDPKEKAKSLIDYYYWYYGSLALNQLDGPDSPKRTNKYWGPWNKAMTESLLSIQSKEEKQCANGGFLKPDRWTYSIGPIYSTAVNVLTLEVYYRYENAFGAAANKRLKKGAAAVKSDKPEDSKPDPASGDKSNK
jgi:hypothetical protein